MPSPPSPWTTSPRPAGGARRSVATLVAAATLLAAGPALAQPTLGLWAESPSPLVADVRAGIDAYYGFDYAEALRRFDRVVAARPRHPIGYFLRAEAYWWQYLNDRQNAGALRQLEGNLEAAIARGEAHLDERPDDPEVRFIVGSAYGRRGMLAGTKKDAWDAARDAQRAKKHLSEVRELAPDVVDALTAEGLYKYYVARFGAVVRAASRLLFGLKGDQEGGLAALDRARREGTYTKVEAAFFEGLFYLQFEDRPVEAQRILDGLRKRYPRNLYFATMAAFARQRQERYEAARTMYEATLDQLARTRVYGREGESITRLFYGQTLMALGALDEAQAQFVRVVQLDARESDAHPHAVLNLGRVADLQNDEAAAQRYYRQVLKLPDAADSHDAARRHLDDPFSASDLPLLVAGAGAGH